MIYVLDACAMIAFLGGEAGAVAVEKALLEAGSQCIAHSINLCEVYYVVWRKGGEVAADSVLSGSQRLVRSPRLLFSSPVV